MTINQYIILLTQQYNISEQDALEIVGLKKYQQEMKKRGDQNVDSKPMDR